MARRFHTKDDDVESEQSTPGSVSLAGIIKLQPNRKKSSSAFTASPMESPYLRSIRPTKASPIPEHQGVLTNRTNILGTPTGISRARGNEVGPDVLQAFGDDRYEQLFGKLPDPIRLHEEMGEFDGQVVFIGHPNRDVSAHQWSSTSFQWVNIGRYAHFRGPLKIFKLAAESREKLIVESGRPKEVPIGVLRSAPVDVTRMESPSTASSLIYEGLPVFTKGSDPSGFLTLEETKSMTPITLHATIKGECLEDPFIAPVRPSSSKISSGLRSRGDKIDPKGSLDFEYEFPFRSITSATPGSDGAIESTSQELIVEGGRSHDDTTYGDTILPGRLSQPALRDIDFGEDAASNLVVPAGHGFRPRKTPPPSSPEDIRNRRKLRSRLAELGASAIRPGALEQGRIATPNYAYIQPTARSLFPPPGLTVANPHRLVSSLNASAPIYANIQGTITGSEASGSEATAINATAAAALKFSDPDGLRQTQDYEIANGLGQQAPTVQCFKGPFFTDSKPTTSDPTVSLSVHISEEEKLVNWFRDGHRPSRQQEYAKTLISAAAPSSRGRSFGVIGECLDAQKDGSYENTPPFVRLYEGLSEYIEEYRNGSGRSYFTRSWKAAPPQLRELGPDGNNSYFNRPTAFQLAQPRY
ncbi:uncharacterized protein K460DRAFT_434533 [Cucurbitaria berberidis CBS 394.84]|uniref:Uncharacterized protein n=1 Tax=Cucurbitaria berberidis CBS 394.84 TaxID=1168544 RepID=A0A9P4G9A5_9PLEO|nr:uncharacterized protein K460DRAFT_434533 [Cucurbitaria berberidis CBS 394.84]KAF1841427.1 hypothetical protein K460DRAFT_434533 [Cucurbitaria berberidis CBS 394.84]